MTYFKKLQGKKCYLSPVDINDAHIYAEWLNDMETSLFFQASAVQMTVENETDYLMERIKRGNHIFAVIDSKTDKLVGTCGLYNVDLLNGKCETAILIGKENWSKGYGTEAMNLLLDYGFNMLNMHNIFLCVFKYNKRAIKSYKKLGFKEIGVRRQARTIGKKKFDLLFMDILADEFESPFIERLLPD